MVLVVLEVQPAALGLLVIAAHAVVLVVPLAVPVALAVSALPLAKADAGAAEDPQVGETVEKVAVLSRLVVSRPAVV